MRRPLSEIRPFGPYAQRGLPPSLALIFSIDRNDSDMLDTSTNEGRETIVELERRGKEVLNRNLGINRIGLEPDEKASRVIIRLGKRGTKFGKRELSKTSDSIKSELEDMGLRVTKQEIGII